MDHNELVPNVWESSLTLISAINERGREGNRLRYDFTETIYQKEDLWDKDYTFLQTKNLTKNLSDILFYAPLASRILAFDPPCRDSV